MRCVTLTVGRDNVGRDGSKLLRRLVAQSQVELFLERSERDRGSDEGGIVSVFRCK